jgi:hypothetical protein
MPSTPGAISEQLLGPVPPARQKIGSIIGVLVVVVELDELVVVVEVVGTEPLGPHCVTAAAPNANTPENVAIVNNRDRSIWPPSNRTSHARSRVFAPLCAVTKEISENA